MIKVNLLKYASQASGLDIKSAQTGGIDRNAIAMKIFSAVFPMLGLYIYEGQLADEKKAELNSLRSQVEEVKTKIQDHGATVEIVERYKSEQQRLNTQVEVIKGLSRDRLREVKALDALQTLVPQKAWLTSISMGKEGVDLAGLALGDGAVSDFTEGLEESLFFNDVILVGVTEEKLNGATFRRFEIGCKLGAIGE
jgi:type IV pilus assembly protein PilN